MKPAKIIEKIGNIKRLRLYCCLVLMVVVLIDFFVPRDHVVFWWDDFPGFDAIYGFVSCVLIILVSKTIGHMGVMQNEDYYQEDNVDD